MERDIVCCVVAVLMNPKDEKARLDGEDAHQRQWMVDVGSPVAVLASLVAMRIGGE